MSHLLIKETVESKNPEESLFIKGFSEAVKEVRSIHTSRNLFIFEYNKWCQKIQSNITFLNGGPQFFLTQVSPSALQRFLVTAFVAICFFESVRSKNADCFLTGVLFCSLLAVMSLITALIGVFTTMPNKSIKSILNWISIMNLVSKEISHRLNKTGRVFQIIDAPGGSENPSNNAFEGNHLQTPAIVNETLKETDFQEFPLEGFDKWCEEQMNKREEKISNNKSNIFVFGSESAEYFSESKSSESGIINEDASKRLAKMHKAKCHRLRFKTTCGLSVNNTTFKKARKSFHLN
ncbi:hypothetical protein HNY73_020995 [Argiope bruennichi]|uniref:Uncharacterized protein n=1 Tax=Argiope bruennichi TaxID=94029 RepID=A0A8T0EDB8_ARGBR|nr:hypothetical protein HNY73_020995 [Argiope bruennichi]